MTETRVSRETLISRLTGISIKGGAGSGFFNHEGRPGERGGSVDDGVPNVESDDMDRSSEPLSLRDGWEKGPTLATATQAERTRFNNSARRELPVYRSAADVPYRPEDRHIEYADRKAPSFFDYAQKMEYNEKTVARVATFRKVVESSPLAIRVYEERLFDLLAEGRFKTQFETGDSAGTYDPDLRSRIEESAFGVPADIDPALRPIYGYVKHGSPSVSPYGNIEMVLKDSVKHRASVTWGDSLTDPAAPYTVGVMIDEMDDDRLVRGALGSYAENFPASSYDIASPPENLYNFSGYIEAQIHGGLALADVDHVVIHSFLPKGQDNGNEQRVVLLKKFGIPAEVAYYTDSKQRQHV